MPLQFDQRILKYFPYLKSLRITLRMKNIAASGINLPKNFRLSMGTQSHINMFASLLLAKAFPSVEQGKADSRLSMLVCYNPEKFVAVNLIRNVNRLSKFTANISESRAGVAVSRQETEPRITQGLLREILRDVAGGRTFVNVNVLDR